MPLGCGGKVVGWVAGPAHRHGGRDGGLSVIDRTCRRRLPVLIFLNAASSTPTAVYRLGVFPTSLRTTEVGFATAMSPVGAAVGLSLPAMGLDRFGVEFVLLVGAGCSPSVVWSRSSSLRRPQTWTSPGLRARLAAR